MENWHFLYAIGGVVSMTGIVAIAGIIMQVIRTIGRCYRFRLFLRHRVQKQLQSPVVQFSDNAEQCLELWK